MAGKGTTPNSASRRTELRGGTRQLASASTNAPPLPGAAEYGTRTLLWYRTWCESENASQFTSLDWQRLHMIAPLVDAYFETDDPSLKLRLIAEIRQNESKLGGTAEDRQRLRWKVEPPQSDGPEGEKPIPSRARKDPRK